MRVSLNLGLPHTVTLSELLYDIIRHVLKTKNTELASY